MRLHLIGDGDTGFEFIWSFHHVLLDGWSLPIVLGDVVTCYEAFRQGHDAVMAPAPSFATFLRWLRAQDMTAAERYWRATLADLARPTRLPAPADSSGSADAIEHDLAHLVIPRATTEALMRVTREYRITLNTLLQGTWALLLSRYTDQADVVFGITVSGRPAELPQAESIAGPFINTLPVRVAVTNDASWPEWLRQLQHGVAEMRQFEYAPLSDIQRWSALPAGAPLFDSVFVFENYPRHISLNLAVAAELSPDTCHTEIACERTRYSVTLTVTPGAELRIGVASITSRVSREVVSSLLRSWTALLDACTPHGLAEPRVGDLAGSFAADASVYTLASSCDAPPVRRDARASANAAPGTSTERRLLDAIRSMLGDQSAGLDDELGTVLAHSLMIAELVVRIRRLFRVAPPLVDVLNAPTIRALAALLDRESALSQDVPAASPVVPIRREERRRRSSWCIRIGGGIAFYVALAPFLERTQPLYGLQAPDLVDAGTQPAYESLSDLASHYIAAIRAARPRGPYVLGGWSFGGVVAFEMAQQLRQEGETVPAVLLLDTYPPGTLHPELDDASIVIVLARESAAQAGVTLDLTADRLQGATLDDQLRLVVDRMKQARLLDAHATVERVHAHIRGYRQRLRLVLAYEPRSCAGRIAVPRDRVGSRVQGGARPRTRHGVDVGAARQSHLRLAAVRDQRDRRLRHSGYARHPADTRAPSGHGRSHARRDCGMRDLLKS